MHLNSQIVGKHGPRPPPDQMQYVLGKVLAGVDHESIDGVVEHFVNALALNNFRDLETSPETFRAGLADIVNKYLRAVNSPNPQITAQVLLELAQEYHIQSTPASGAEEVGHAAAAAAQEGPAAATIEQMLPQVRTYSAADPALERGMAEAVDAAAARAAGDSLHDLRTAIVETFVAREGAASSSPTRATSPTAGVRPSPSLALSLGERMRIARS